MGSKSVCNKNKCVVICGPTASGKSSMGAILASEFNGVVISADSMQIYRGFEIGTAKPTTEELSKVEHRLIGFLDPRKTFSVAQYQSLALKETERILSEGRLPFIVGGTGLYVDSILHNTKFANYGEDPGIRKGLESDFDSLGAEAMLDRLKAVDPDAAARLHPADRKRILRALEIYKLTGVTATRHNLESRSVPSRYDFLVLTLCYEDRSKLYSRIDERVDLMLENGLLDEARSMYEAGEENFPTLSQAIGYKELFSYFKGESTLEDAVELLKRRSRNYAKRQMTWFRKYDSVHITMDDGDGLRRAREEVKKFTEEG